MSHLDPVAEPERAVSRRRLSRPVRNTFKYVNICSPAGHWGHCGQFDPSGAKPPAVARCLNKARCAAVASQHLAQTLIHIQTLWSHRRGTKRIPWIAPSLSFWNDETSPLRGVETRRRDGSPAWISFQASATKHLSLFLMDKTWHLSALDLQRCTLLHNTADAD